MPQELLNICLQIVLPNRDVFYDITPSIRIAIATNTKSILITILVAPVPSHRQPKVIVSDR